MRRLPRHLVVTTLAAGALLAACGPSGTTTEATKDAPGTTTRIPAADEIDPARLAPLAGLPACPDAPDAPDDLDLVSAPLPLEAIATQSSTTGSLRSVQGWSPHTPVEIMVGYLRLEDWEVLAAEDEVFESEVLLTDGTLRVFVKSQAVCDRGSAFVLFASDDTAVVPTPAGTP